MALLALAALLLPAAATATAAVLAEDDACGVPGSHCSVGLLQQASQRQGQLPASMQAVLDEGKPVYCQDPTFRSCDPHFERLRVASVPMPRPRFGQALVRVEASSVNPSDWKFLSGFNGVIGKDFAGTVVASSFPCTFSKGDLVWGDAVTNGAFAEYLVADCKKLGLRPGALSAAEAGALPHVSLASLQALTMAGAPWSGSPSVLVLGGSGGTGHVAVQLARALGAGHVAATCSAANEEFVRSLGADQAIDYHTQNWWEVLSSVDIIYDTVGQDGTGEHAYKLLNDGGFLVTIADGPEVLASKATAASRPEVSQAFSGLSDNSKNALDVLKGFADSGGLKVKISKSYDGLSNVLAALEESKAGHAVGKISLNITSP